MASDPTFEDTAQRPRVFGVVGTPDVVARSLSPAMFAAAFAELGLPWYYVPFAVQPDAVHVALRSLSGLGISGVNVTMPFKGIAASEADSYTTATRRSGIANTLTIDDSGTIHADASDGRGLHDAMIARGFDLATASVLLIGAGGVARDIACTLADAGIQSLSIWNRTQARSEELARLIAAQWDLVGLEVFSELPIDDAAHVVISAVPDGSTPHAVLENVEGRSLVVDLSYRPDRMPTELIRAAASCGVPAIDGLELLVRQGAVACERWSGRPAPIEVMQRAVQG
jgi:shikimate dehydrogenase